jgi:hypothetical protein
MDPLSRRPMPPEILTSEIKTPRDHLKDDRQGSGTGRHMFISNEDAHPPETHEEDTLIVFF